MNEAAPVVRPQDRVKAPPPRKINLKDLPLLSLTALGVVYGDIGTSPIYVLRQCFHGASPVSATAGNVLGLLSLIFWSLVTVISVKYLAFILRADNRGEGGILALTALLDPRNHGRISRAAIAILGTFGAALLFGDGMITPAISVLSAVEGLEKTAPTLRAYIVPITIAILVLLFLFQRRGTAGIGQAFGPVMLLWFGTLAALGIWGIVQDPRVLTAVNPWFAVRFFHVNHWTGYIILASVFLAVTGGEALYADIGHFGRTPIRLAWFFLVMPALLLNYFGQGGVILAHPHKISRPFYDMAPPWALYPLVFLTTVATVIASQAVISGAFSLTRQAVQLGYSPRLHIVHTSAEEIGQIYVPTVNWILMAATIGLVIGFGSSDHLGSAYGVAVSATMVITTVLAYLVMRERWHWHPMAAVAIALSLVAVDLAFFGANITKFIHGGWFPLAAASVLFTVMAAWRAGRVLLAKRLRRDVLPLRRFLDDLQHRPPPRVPGCAVFMTGRRRGTPAMLRRHLAHMPALSEQVVMLTILVRGIPRVGADDRLCVMKLPCGLYRVYAYYGFMQRPHVPVILRECERYDLVIDPDTVTYYVGKEIILPSAQVRGMALWRQRLFGLMSRNQARADQFLNIPHDRMIELGIVVTL